jgi:hypothetical protein
MPKEEEAKIFEIVRSASNKERSAHKCVPIDLINGRDATKMLNALI